MPFCVKEFLLTLVCNLFLNHLNNIAFILPSKIILNYRHIEFQASLDYFFFLRTDFSLVIFPYPMQFLLSLIAQGMQTVITLRTMFMPVDKCADNLLRIRASAFIFSIYLYFLYMCVSISVILCLFTVLLANYIYKILFLYMKKYRKII